MAGSNIQTNWKGIKEARAAILKRAETLRKEAFIQMPGGSKEAQMAPGGDPAAMGGDPAAMGGMPPGGDPAAMGGMPPGGDPAAMGGMPMDPAMMGGDPAAMGAPMGVDPAMAGMIAPPPDAAAGAAAAGAAGAGTAEPTITITLSQLWDVVTKMIGLAKKIGANGQGAVDASPQATPAQGTPDQDAIKSAVMEALGAMGAMR